VGEIEEIPAPGIRALSPAVSPDGRWVAFRGGFGNDVSLWLVPFDGSAPPRRIASGRNLILLRWPSDPGWLYASVSDGGTPPILEQISIPDGAERPLGVPVRFGATGTIACFDVARDAPWMVYGREETPEGDIWVLESEPGAF
jgi:hypothetical protein